VAAATSDPANPVDADVIMETEQEKQKREEKQDAIRAAFEVLNVSEDVTKFLTEEQAVRFAKMLGEPPGLGEEDPKKKSKREKEKERRDTRAKAGKEREEALARREAALDDIEANWEKLQKKRGPPTDGGYQKEAETDRLQKKLREKKDDDECNEFEDKDMLTSQGKEKFQADPSTCHWDVNLFLPASKVERDSTCVLPKDSVIGGALTLAPNGEGKFKTPIRFDRKPPSNVTRAWAGRVVQKRDSISDNTDEKSEKKSRDVAEAVQRVLVRFFEGCSEFLVL